MQITGRLTAAATNIDNAFNFQVTDSAANSSKTGMRIDYNASDNTTLTADRTHIGLEVDYDVSAAGGDTSNEYRAYAISVDLRGGGDTDIRRGVYSYSETQHNAGTVSENVAVYGYAVADETGTGKTTNNYGGLFLAYENGTGTGGNNTHYGVYAKSHANSLADKNIDSMYGGMFEAEYDTTGATTTITNVVGVRSTIDIDSTDTNVTNSYVFWGEYQGTPNATNAYGIYLTSDVKNRLGGKLQIGTGTNENAFGRLQVNQSANNDESGIGILSSGAARSMRLWVDETTSYINSGNGGAGDLVFNEAATVSSGGNLNLNGKLSIEHDGSTTGDLLSLFSNRFDGTTMYGWGVNNGTLYHKAATRHQFYTATNYDNSSYDVQFDGQNFIIRTGDLMMGGNTFVDSSRNITAGTISSGAITSTGNMSLSNSNAGNNITINRTDVSNSAIFHIGSSRGYIGTTSNTLFEIRQNNVAAIVVDTSGNTTIENNLVVDGNLTVSGTTTTLNTTTLDVEDKNITLNYSTGDSSATADGAGITIQDAVNSTTNATILWDGTNDEWDFSHGIHVDGKSIFRTNSNVDQLTIRRSTGDSQSLRIGVDDEYTRFYSEQDETGRYGGYYFYGTHNGTNRSRLEITDTTGDVILFNTTGTSKWKWDAVNERQGIGTSSPNYRMHVYSPSGQTGLAITRGLDEQAPMIRFNSDSTKSFLYANGDFIISTTTTGAGNTSYSEVLRVTDDQLVGIGGLSTPSAKLHVADDQYLNFMVQSTGAGYAPASVFLRAGNSTNRGAGVYSHNSVNDKIWFAGTVYQNDTASWNVCYNGDASALSGGETAVAQTSHRLFNVYSNGDVNIVSGSLDFNDVTVIDSSRHITAPQIRLTSIDDAGVSSTSHAFQIGPDNSANVIMDSNEIMARNNGATSDLHINPDGGGVTVGNNSNTGSLVVKGTGYFSKDVTLEGNDVEIRFAGGNNRILFSGYRALEGATNGGILQVGEGYTTVQSYGHFNLTSGHEYQVNGTTVIDSGRGLTNITGLNLSSSTTSGMKLTATDSTANANFYGFHIDYNASGSDTTTTDRAHTALYIDADSSATGGGTSHEHRFYGIFADVRASGDSDLQTGIYTTVRADNFGSGNTVSNLRGGHFVSISHHDAGTLTSLYGSYSDAQCTDSGSGRTSNVYGSYSRAYAASTSSYAATNYTANYNIVQISATNNVNINDTTGVRGEIQLDNDGAADHSVTISNAFVFRAEYDENDADDSFTVNNGYLYYGNYAGERPTTAWGVYIADDVENYFAGSIRAYEGYKVGTTQVIDSSTNATFKTVTIDPTVNGPALNIKRYTGQPNIKAGTDDGGYLIMDSNGGMAALNWYSSDRVVLALGGGNVSIGSSSNHTEKLHVTGTLKSTDDLSTQGNFSLDRSDGFAYLSNVGTGNAGIYVRGIGASNILRSHTTGEFRWEILGSQKMMMDSSGRLIVGADAANGDNAVTLNGGGYVYAHRASGVSGYFDRDSSGDVVTIRYSGGDVGHIGIEGNDSIYIQSEGSSGVGLRFHPTSGVISPVRNGALASDVVSLGTATQQFNNLHLAGEAHARELFIEKFTNTTGTTGSTLLTLTNYVGTTTGNGDLSQQKTFIDFALKDGNSNETPQVRIGAEVGEKRGCKCCKPRRFRSICCLYQRCRYRCW